MIGDSYTRCTVLCEMKLYVYEIYFEYVNMGNKSWNYSQHPVKLVKRSRWIVCIFMIPTKLVEPTTNLACKNWVCTFVYSSYQKSMLHIFMDGCDKLSSRPQKHDLLVVYDVV